MLRPLQISVAPSLGGAVARVDLTPETLAALAATDARESKDGGGWWSPFTWVGDVRKATGCEAVSALVYDLDHGLPPDLQATLDAHGFGYALAETWSRDRWRLIVPLAQPLAPQDHGDAWSELGQLLGLQPDPSTRDLARIYYPCGGPPGEARRALQAVG